MDVTKLSPQELMELISLIVCLPLVLLMNFSLFQYLVTMFYRRRREPLVALLLAVAFLSFFSLIPFGFPDIELVRDLNDISETCSVLTFLLQISILTRDINRKMKIKALVWMLFIGEILALFGLVVLGLNIVDIVAPVIDLDGVEILDDLVEDLSLLFIVVFRFAFLFMAKGYRTVLRSQKMEIFYYILFLTHEYPFMLLDHLTGLSWEHVQGVWMRVTIGMCLWTTIKARLSSRNSRLGGRTTGPARGPSTTGDKGGWRREGPNGSVTGVEGTGGSKGPKSVLHLRNPAAVTPFESSSCAPE